MAGVVEINHRRFGPRLAGIPGDPDVVLTAVVSAVPDARHKHHFLFARAKDGAAMHFRRTRQALAIKAPASASIGGDNRAFLRPKVEVRTPVNQFALKRELGHFRPLAPAVRGWPTPACWGGSL